MMSYPESWTAKLLLMKQIKTISVILDMLVVSKLAT